MSTEAASASQATSSDVSPRSRDNFKPPVWKDDWTATRYREEVLLWRLCTSVKLNKQCGAVVYAQPDTCARKAKMTAWVLQNYDKANSDKGLEEMITAIAGEEPGDEFRLYEAWLALEKCQRFEKEKMSVFIDRMNECLRRCRENGLQLPDDLVALLFIMRCKIDGPGLRALLIEAGNPPKSEKVTASLRQQFQLEQIVPKPFRPAAAAAEARLALEDDFLLDDIDEEDPEEEALLEALLARRTLRLGKGATDAEALAAKKKKKQQFLERKKKNADRLKTLQCWTCGGYGHLSNSPQCPQYKKKDPGAAVAELENEENDAQGGIATLSSVNEELGAFVAEMSPNWDAASFPDTASDLSLADLL